jgi:hypothetical protein
LPGKCPIFIHPTQGAKGIQRYGHLQTGTGPVQTQILNYARNIQIWPNIQKKIYKAFSKLAHIENGPSNEEEKDEEEKNSFGRLSPVLARNHWPKKGL